MGVIGTASREKENKEISPGPSAYTPSQKQPAKAVTIVGKRFLSPGKPTPGPGMY